MALSYKNVRIVVTVLLYKTSSALIHSFIAIVYLKSPSPFILYHYFENLDYCVILSCVGVAIATCMT